MGFLPTPGNPCGFILWIIYYLYCGDPFFVLPKTPSQIFPPAFPLSPLFPQDPINSNPFPVFTMSRTSLNFFFFFSSCLKISVHSLLFSPPQIPFLGFCFPRAADLALLCPLLVQLPSDISCICILNYYPLC